MAKRRSPKTVESRLPPQGALRTKEDQDRLAGAALLDGQGRVDPLALAVNVTAATTPFTRGIALKPPFPGARIASEAPRVLRPGPSYPPTFW